MLLRSAACYALLLALQLAGSAVVRLRCFRAAQTRHARDAATVSNPERRRGAARRLDRVRVLSERSASYLSRGEPKKAVGGREELYGGVNRKDAARS